MAAEDFSFPVINEGSPSCIDSPPMWHLSPVARREETISAEPNDIQHVGPTTKKRRTRSKRIAQDSGCGCGSDEETMDMLWEDFNEEELSRTCSSSSQAPCMEMLEMGRRARNNALTVSNAAKNKNKNKKPGVVVFIRVLKKLFLLPNDGRSLNKSPWHLKQPHSCNFSRFNQS